MGEKTNRRISDIEYRGSFLTRWALGIVGALVTGSVIWLASTTIAHGESIVTIETKIDFMVDTLKEIKQHMNKE